MIFVMKDEDIFEQLKKCIAETIGIAQEEIMLDSSLINDLGADSLDLLDLVFRIEQSFKIKITRGEIERRTRETLPEEEFEKDGYLTEKAKQSLQQALPEVESLKFEGNLRKNDIPKLFTVRTFVRLIKEKISQD